MRNMKFKVRDEQHSKEIQDALFAAGYKWWGCDSHTQLTRPYLYASTSNKTITYGDERHYFDGSESEEHLVADGFIYPLGFIPSAWLSQPTETPLGLRPKCIAEAIRKQEVLEAITRYVEAAKKVPQEWLEEFAELNGRMK